MKAPGFGRTKDIVLIVGIKCAGRRRFFDPHRLSINYEKEFRD